MICDEHNIDDITSSDPRVAIVLLRRELENLRKENNLIVERNEILIKSNKHMAQKLKQTEDELKLIKDSETSFPEEEKNLLKQISTEMHNNNHMLNQILDKKTILKTKKHSQKC